MRAEIKYFLTVGGGAIVNTGSGAGLKYTPGLGAYAAAKHGLVGLTKQTAVEYGADDIRVNAVAPELTITDAFSPLPADDRAVYEKFCHRPVLGEEVLLNEQIVEAHRLGLLEQPKSFFPELPPGSILGFRRSMVNPTCI